MSTSTTSCSTIACQVFIANKDWPGNNYKAFRYYPSEGEEITSEFQDGRWRFMFFDAEYAWSLYGERPNADTLRDLLSGTHMSGESKALIALLAREDMAREVRGYDVRPYGERL